MSLSCKAKLYSGKCPKIYKNVTIDCKNKLFSRELKVVGLLSSSSDTLNFFHNEFDSIKCISIELNCLNYEGYLLDFNIVCNVLENFKHCYPIVMSSGTKLNEYHLKFDFTKNTFCPEDIIKKEIQFLYNDNFQHMIIYGCYETKQNESDYGVWILATDELMQKVKVQEFKEQTKKILDEVNPNLMTDLLFYDADIQECNCNACDYFMSCETSQKFKMNKESRGNKTGVASLIIFIVFIKNVFIAQME